MTYASRPSFSANEPYTRPEVVYARPEAVLPPPKKVVSQPREEMEYAARRVSQPREPLEVDISGTTDKLRVKLLDVGQMLVGFDKAVEEDTRRRRGLQHQKLSDIMDAVQRFEQDMNAEMKGRIEETKALEQRAEHMLGDMLYRVKARLSERFEGLSLAVESLLARASTMERGIQQLRGTAPSKLQVETVAQSRRVAELLREVQEERRLRIEQDAHVLRLIDEAEYGVDSQMEHELADLERRAESLQQLADESYAPPEGQEEARRRMTEVVQFMRAGLLKESQERERMDDEVVQAINDYTGALQRGLRKATA